MKFSKYYQPKKNRKKSKRKLDYTERQINACKEMLIDKSLGYEISANYYNEKYNLKGDEK